MQRFSGGRGQPEPISFALDASSVRYTVEHRAPSGGAPQCSLRTLGEPDLVGSGRATPETRAKESGRLATWDPETLMVPKVKQSLLRLAGRLGFHPWPIATPRRQRQAWFSVICLAALAYELVLIFAPRSAAWTDDEEVRIDEFGAGATVSQWVIPEFDGLNGITVSLRADQHVETAVRCELWRLEQPARAWTPISQWTELLAGYGRLEHRFRFPPLVESGGRTFRLDLRRAPGGRPIALALIAWRENVRPGSLRVDGTERWGDLVMRLHAANRYRTFLLKAKMPALLKHPAVILTILALYNWALITLAFYVVVIEDE